MKKILFVLFTVTWALTPVARTWADDPEVAPASGTFATPGTSTGTDPSLVSKGTDATPPANWSKLRGTVDSVEATSNHLRIMDSNGNATDVVAGDNVVIKESGKTVSFADVQPGDHVTLTNKAASSTSH